MSNLNVGYMTNAFGPLVGSGGGVINPKDVRYLTMCCDEDAIKKITSCGFNSIEIFDGNLDNYCDDPQKFADILKKYNANLLGVYIGASYIYDSLDDELARIEHSCALAAELGAKHIVLGGGAVRASGIQDDDYKKLAAGVAKAADIARKYHLTPGYHPHLGCMVENPQQIDKFFSLCDVDFVPDIAHLAAGGGDPLEIIKKYYSKIKYVHLKDMKNGEFCPLGTGDINLEDIINYLKQNNYQGDWLVEIDGFSGDPTDACKISFDYVNKFIQGNTAQNLCE